MTQYDLFAKTFSNSRKDMHWPEIDTILSDLEKNEYTSVLDIGCGNGRFVGELRKKSARGLTYLGVDASEGMIFEAENLLPNEEFLISSMPLLSEISKDKTFDAIVLLASFHHLESEKERKECLLRLKDFLAPNGCIYITNWNLCDQKKYSKNHRGNGDYEIKIGEFSRYYHGFTLTELEELFEDSGWKIEENRIFEGGRNFYSQIKSN